MPSTIAASWVLLLSVGCGAPDAEPVDTSAPADTDADTDVETDTDTGTPVTPSDPYTFDGNVTVRSTVDGATVCDLDATLTGSPYTGTCPDCEFTFVTAIEDTITRDDSVGHCPKYSQASFIESFTYFDLLMAAAPAYYRDYPYLRYDDAFLVGWSYRGEYGDDTYVREGPFFLPIAYDGSSSTTFTRVGDELSWSYSYEGVYQAWEFNHYQDCGTVQWSDATEGFGVPGTGVTTTLDCTAHVIDVWTFEADGGPVTVTVDSVSRATAFNPTLEVNGPDGCTISQAFENFECTYPPPRFACPSVSLDVTDPGTHTVVVGKYAPCTDRSGEYELRIEGGTDLTLVEDEADHNILVDHLLRIDIHGTGTLTVL